MEYIIYLYIFFTGLVYASWMWETKDHFFLKFLGICIGFIYGWFATPLLIGRAIKQIYKD